MCSPLWALSLRFPVSHRLHQGSPRLRKNTAGPPQSFLPQQEERVSNKVLVGAADQANPPNVGPSIRWLCRQELVSPHWQPWQELRTPLSKLLGGDGAPHSYIRMSSEQLEGVLGTLAATASREARKSPGSEILNCTPLWLEPTTSHFIHSCHPLMLFWGKPITSYYLGEVLTPPNAGGQKYVWLEVEEEEKCS